MPNTNPTFCVYKNQRGNINATYIAAFFNVWLVFSFIGHISFECVRFHMYNLWVSSSRNSSSSVKYLQCTQYGDHDRARVQSASLESTLVYTVSLWLVWVAAWCIQFGVFCNKSHVTPLLGYEHSSACLSARRKMMMMMDLFGKVCNKTYAWCLCEDMLQINSEDAQDDST